nr:MAG TPA: hypothetical protein [Caudoviricetes sp.]
MHFLRRSAYLGYFYTAGASFLNKVKTPTSKVFITVNH